MVYIKHPRRRFPFWEIAHSALISLARWAHFHMGADIVEDFAGRPRVSYKVATGAEVKAGDFVAMRGDGTVEPVKAKAAGQPATPEKIPHHTDRHGFTWVRYGSGLKGRLRVSTQVLRIFARKHAARIEAEHGKPVGDLTIEQIVRWIEASHDDEFRSFITALHWAVNPDVQDKPGNVEAFYAGMMVANPSSTEVEGVLRAFGNKHAERLFAYYGKPVYDLDSHEIALWIGTHGRVAEFLEFEAAQESLKARPAVDDSDTIFRVPVELPLAVPGYITAKGGMIRAFAAQHREEVELGAHQALSEIRTADIAKWIGTSGRIGEFRSFLKANQPAAASPAPETAADVERKLAEAVEQKLADVGVRSVTEEPAAEVPVGAPDPGLPSVWPPVDPRPSFHEAPEGVAGDDVQLRDACRKSRLPSWSLATPVVIGNNLLLPHKAAAQLLVETGLLFEINRSVLHPLGLALMVDDFGIRGLLDARHDPEGFVFNEEDVASGTKKFFAYMAERGHEALATRRKLLGFQEQPLPGEADDDLVAALLGRALDRIRKAARENTWLRHIPEFMAGASPDDVVDWIQPAIVAEWFIAFQIGHTPVAQITTDRDIMKAVTDAALRSIKSAAAASTVYRGSKTDFVTDISDEIIKQLKVAYAAGAASVSASPAAENQDAVPLVERAYAAVSHNAPERPYDSP